MSRRAAACLAAGDRGISAFSDSAPARRAMGNVAGTLRVPSAGCHGRLAGCHGRLARPCWPASGDVGHSRTRADKLPVPPAPLECGDSSRLSRFAGPPRGEFLSLAARLRNSGGWLTSDGDRPSAIWYNRPRAGPPGPFAWRRAAARIAGAGALFVERATEKRGSLCAGCHWAACSPWGPSARRLRPSGPSPGAQQAASSPVAPGGPFPPGRPRAQLKCAEPGPLLTNGLRRASDP